jgi:hypothetical protein
MRATATARWKGTEKVFRSVALLVIVVHPDASGLHRPLHDRIRSAAFRAGNTVIFEELGKGPIIRFLLPAE